MEVGNGPHMLASMAAGAAATAACCLLKAPTRPPRGEAVAGAPVDSSQALQPGRCAVICGAASGIGLQTARQLASMGMKVVMADIDAADLEAAAAEVTSLAKNPNFVMAKVVDVSKLSDMQALKTAVYGNRDFAEVAFLMNNAAIQNNGKASATEHIERWQDIMSVNLWGVIHGVQVFAEAMVAQGTPAVIVNTGSKQGITMPPGDTAYNVSKAGVKVLTEGLQHSLRSRDGCKVNAFLLVPGWTITMIGTRANQRLQGGAWKPESAQDERSYDGVADAAVARAKLEARGAWPASMVVDRMISSVRVGAPFYIICPDHETSEATDLGRIQWAADDLIFSRVPLSRWSPQYSAEFKALAATFDS